MSWLLSPASSRQLTRTMSRETMWYPVRCDRAHQSLRGPKVSEYGPASDDAVRSDAEERRMSAIPHAEGVRLGEPDPHIVELSKLMLARAPALGEALADRLFREIDA